MKIELNHDELWPWFRVGGGNTYSLREVEVPEEVVRRWDRVTLEFFKMQREMQELYGHIGS